MLCYCKKCGRIILFLLDKDEKICDCCKSEVFPIPEKYLNTEFSIKEEIKQQFIDEYIKSSPEFDQYLFEHRDEILAKQSAEFNAKMEHGKSILDEQARTPKCPTCGSTNIKKITGTERAASVIGLSIFSKKINKNYKCKHCGYTW